MQNRYERCPNCMNLIQGQEKVCQSCGFDFIHYEEKATCLKPFTVLQNKYMIGRVIGVGGFGITYIGWDLNLQTYIAIKEYFPDSIASRDTVSSPDITQVVTSESKAEIYNKGLNRYVEEARNLSKFYNLQGIVSVKDFFYENGTGYIVMEYINGINLKEFLRNSGGRLEEDTVLALMKPVLESLYQIHNAGLVHRDISPDNIMVDGNGKIKLIDFGSARGESAETDKTYTVILKHGYAPSEQYYAKGKQGPWTDIYSICATMYKMLTGQIPPNSIERMERDAYAPPSAWGIKVSPRTEAVIAKGLAVRAADRYQNIGELLIDLYGDKPQDNPNNMPVNSAAAYASPVSQQSLSQQSMHLNVAKSAKAKSEAEQAKNKQPVIVGAIAAAAVLICIVLALLLGGSKDRNDNKNTELADNKTSEASTDETDEKESTDDTEVVYTEEITETEENTDEATDATTELADNLGQQTGYVWPTELSDNWKDHMIKIDDTIYQFPIPYTEFASKGWRADQLPTYIAAGDTEYAEFYDNKLEFTVYITNFGVNEATVDECYVVGIDINSRYDDVSDKADVEIAGGIKLFGTTKAEAKKILGAPDYTYDSSEYKYEEIAYYSSGYDKGLDLEFSTETGFLASITMANAEAPEGAASTTEIDINPPEINSLYVAPSAASTDKSDNIITVDGLNVKLPCPVSEFINDGWTLDDDTAEYISAGSYDSSIVTSLEKNGNKITVSIENMTKNVILPQNGLITQISVESSYCDAEVIFPAGISLGGDASLIKKTYKNSETYSMNEYSSFNSYYIHLYLDADEKESIYIDAYSDPQTNKITKYSYSGYGLSLE